MSLFGKEWRARGYGLLSCRSYRLWIPYHRPVEELEGRLVGVEEGSPFISIHLHNHRNAYMYISQYYIMNLLPQGKKVGAAWGVNMYLMFTRVWQVNV